MALSPLELHLAAVAAFGVVCFLVGYGVGGQRVFASLSYFNEGLFGVYQTMLPHYGIPKWLRKRREARWEKSDSN